MKKLFLLLTMAVSAISSFAQDSDLTKYVNDTYNGFVDIIINGEKFAEAQPADVIINKKGDNIIDFTLKNFIIGAGEDAMNVGNINVKDIQLSVSAKPNATEFENKQIILIEEGDVEDVFLWVGPMIGEIPVEIKGVAANDDVDIDIEIDMMATLEQMIHVDFYASGTSGITNINADKKMNNNIIYNVIGQKVAASAKGLQIVNGRKYVNK